MNKIDLYRAQKEKSRLLFMKTGDLSHLDDVVMFRRLIEAGDDKFDVMSKALLGLMAMTLMSPWILWMICEVMR